MPTNDLIFGIYTVMSANVIIKNIFYRVPLNIFETSIIFKTVFLLGMKKSIDVFIVMNHPAVRYVGRLRPSNNVSRVARGIHRFFTRAKHLLNLVGVAIGSLDFFHNLPLRAHDLLTQILPGRQER